MNDLDLIQDLVPEVRLPGPAELAPAQARLAAAIAAEHGSGRAPARAVAAGAGPAARGPAPAGPAGAGPGRAGRLRRLVPVALAAGALAAVVAGLIVVATPAHVRGPGVSVRGPVVDSAAAAVLRKAALAALHLPATSPRPDQFVYMEYVYRSSQYKRSVVFQEWLSVDGSQTGLFRYGDKYTVAPGCPASAAGHGCEPTPAFLPDLPTTPRAMFTYLEKTDGVRPGGSPDDLNKLGKGADELLTFNYLLPKQRAALYEVLAQTPGFSINPHAFDAAGRPGIGISWIFAGGSKTMIIFDPRTYVELGFDTWGAGSDRNVEESSGLLNIAIVDRVGQLP